MHIYPANKTVRMPLRIQCRNVILHDGPIAAIAFRRKHVKVIVATVRFAVTLMEAFFAELLAALGTKEMLRVPRFLQCSHTFL